MPSLKTDNWIFLRGLARSSGHWGVFPEKFQAMFPNANVEMLDIAGNGTEHHRQSFLSIEENVADLRKRSQLIAEGPVNICAISLGGMFALKWAEQHPEDFGRIILMNTSDPRHSFFFERLRPGNYLSLLNLLVQKRDPLAREKEVLRMTTRLVKNTDELAAQYAPIPTPSAGNFLRQLRAAQSFQTPKQAPNVPMLFLAGEKDFFVNPICSKRLAWAWDQLLMMHPEAGHDLSTDAPDWICEKIRDWVNL